MLKKISILLLASLSLSACAEKSQQQNKEFSLIDYKYRKSICYGRLTITVPKETEVNFGSSEYDGIKIEVNKDINSYENFKNFINKNIHELKILITYLKITYLMRKLISLLMGLIVILWFLGQALILLVCIKSMGIYIYHLKNQC